MTDRDYVLGTHDEEIERLGLQHRVWRGRVLSGWQQAGIRTGLTVLDVGAGPGYASLDLAEIVGPEGRVIAVERSARFLSALRQRAAARGLGNIETVEADVTQSGFGEGVADAAWCRWLLSFVGDPARVVSHIAAALRPGGTAIFHEYADYGLWQLLPPDPRHDRFVDLVRQSWIGSGGDPDVALRLPAFAAEAGLEVIAINPIVQTVRPVDFMWEWPASFIRINVDRLRELGVIGPEEAESLAGVIDEAALDPNRFMLTPLVLEVVARRR